jgi:hypothetical protein
MDSQYTRYAPMNRSHIPGFPNRLPRIDWKTYLPKFKDEEGDDASLHLIKFHMHVHKLKVKFHEYCLMKMFMATLEGKARSWYEKLPAASLYSLKDFHTIFFENYRKYYPSLLLVQNCCEHFESFIQFMEDVYDDDVFMDDEIIESLHKNHFHHQVKNVETSCHDTQENSQQVVVSPLVVNEENRGNFQHIVVSFVDENETNLHLNDEIHIPSPKLVEEIQWSYHILGDQEEVYDGKSFFSTVLLSP